VTSEHQEWRAGPDGGMEWVSEPVTEQKFVSRTCQGERPVEVATRTLIGRALRARGGGP